MTVDKTGVEKTVVDETGVDELGINVFLCSDNFVKQR